MSKDGYLYNNNEVFDAYTSVPSTDRGFTGDCVWWIDKPNTTMYIAPALNEPAVMGNHQFLTARNLKPIASREFWDVESLVIEPGVIAPENSDGLFTGFPDIGRIDAKNLDTSNVVNMEGMFYSLEGLFSLDVSGWDTSKVTNMSQMFYDCYSMSSLDLSSFDTSKVTDMSQMFYGCSSLEDVNLSSFDTPSVKDMSSMFEVCEELELLDLSSFDMTNVESVEDMLASCESLETLRVNDTWDAQRLNDEAYLDESVDLVVAGNDGLADAYKLDASQGDKETYTIEEVQALLDAKSDPALFEEVRVKVNQGLMTTSSELQYGVQFSE